MSKNLFCGKDIDSLELPLKKLLKSDYLVYFDENDPNFSEKDISKLSNGSQVIKLKSKGRILIFSFDSFQKQKNIRNLLLEIFSVCVNKIESYGFCFTNSKRRGKLDHFIQIKKGVADVRCATNNREDSAK